MIGKRKKKMGERDEEGRKKRDLSIGKERKIRKEGEDESNLMEDWNIGGRRKIVGGNVKMKERKNRKKMERRLGFRSYREKILRNLGRGWRKIVMENGKNVRRRERSLDLKKGEDKIGESGRMEVGEDIIGKVIGKSEVIGCKEDEREGF